MEKHIEANVSLYLHINKAIQIPAYIHYFCPLSTPGTYLAVNIFTDIAVTCVTPRSLFIMILYLKQYHFLGERMVPVLEVV